MKIVITAFFIIFLSVQKLYIPQFVPLVTVNFAYRYEYAQRFCRSKYLCILQTSLDIQLLPTPCIYFLQAFLKYLGIACIECFAQILFRSRLYSKVVGSISFNLIDLRLFQTNCLEIVYRLSTDIYSVAVRSGFDLHRFLQVLSFKKEKNSKRLRLGRVSNLGTADQKLVVLTITPRLLDEK